MDSEIRKDRYAAFSAKNVASRTGEFYHLIAINVNWKKCGVHVEFVGKVLDKDGK